MNFSQAAILGVVQGLSEFLPISSSGHLVIVQNLLGVNEGAVVFDIFVHFATLFAVLFYFRKELLSITKKELLAIVVASIPAGVIGLFFEDMVTQAFGSLLFVGIALMVTGCLNFITYHNLKKNKSGKTEVGLKEALMIGTAQAMAILPGISRSGSTVSMSSMQQIDRKVAFRFSFLMVVPVIFGANMIHLLRFLNGEPLLIPVSVLLFGGLLAFLSGILSLKIFEYVIAKAKMNIFGVYCIAIGLLVVFSTLK